jgi:hypothetical protein
MDPYEIMISTKAKTGGAAASLKGLYDTINDKSDKFSPGFWRGAKAKKFKNIITTIMESSAIDGVLDVASTEGLISAVDKNRILSGLAAERDRSAVFKPTRVLSDYMSQYGANTNHPSYSAAKHALASVARQLTDKLNDEDYTDIVKQILNHANIVQMYFNAIPKGEDLICKGFTLVWPPQFDGKIHFYSGKVFSATEIKGRLGFKIGKGAQLVDDPDDSLRAPTGDIARARAARAAEKAADVAVGKITKKGERDVRDPTVKDVTALGRTKKS